MGNTDIDYSKVYPSSRMIQNLCSEEYNRVSEIYDKIYDKVNIALAFSGVILLVIVSGVDYTIITKHCNSTLKVFICKIIVFSCSVISSVCIVWAVIQLLSILHSRRISMIDCVTIRNIHLYREEEEVFSMWLIDKYTRIIPKIKKIIKRKQEIYDSAITKIVFALVSYSIAIVLQKGV